MSFALTRTSTSTRKTSSTLPRIQLASVQACNSGGAQLVRVQIVAHHRRRRIPGNVELVHFEREDSDVIVVRLVADWGARPTVSFRAEVGHSLRTSTRRVPAVAGTVS